MSNLDAAIMMAVKAHKDQKDLSGEPYILHRIKESCFYVKTKKPSIVRHRFKAQTTTSQTER